jgi:hypothetical protein
VPLLPIDLQTIFSQLGNVGKEQAAQRDVVPLAQTVRGSEMVQQTYRQDRSVNETRDAREGEKPAIEERRRRSRGRDGAEKHENGEGEAGEAERGRPAVFRDPALGSHIDVVR